MQAVAVRAFHETPSLMELPRPSPGAGEVLVRMGAAGVNPLDWKIVEGFYDGQRPHQFPLVVGVDGAGSVEAVGSGVRQFRVGDPIFGQFLHRPVGTGTYAEYTTVPESIAVLPFPSEMTAAAAAALPTAGMTALSALDRLGLGSGSSLLIVGAGGGVGSLATSLASARQIRVTAVVRTGSPDWVRKLGASEVLVSAPDLPVEELRAGHPSGFDGVLDLAGDATAFAHVSTLARSGGAAATTRHVANPETNRAPGVKIFNADLDPSRELLSRLLGEITSIGLAVPVEREVKLRDGPSVLAESRQGHGAGKTVIRIS